MKGASRKVKGAARALSPRRRSRDDEAGSASGTERALASPTSHRRRQRGTLKPPPGLPGLELSEEDFLKEWGITRDREEALLVEYRAAIEAELGPLQPDFDKYYLRRFLRARQHDLKRAKEMFMAHFKWRKEMGIDTIQDDFHFHERDAFLSLYPQGYHKTDRLGRPVYIQHLGSINVKALAEVTTEDRMVRFHVQEYERALRYIFPACSLVAGRHVSQTLAVMDLKGVGLRHLSGDVKRILGRITRTDQDNYPETLGKTLIINAPTVFRAIWAIVKPMLDARTQAKIEVCPSDYMKELVRWVDPENIPQYLGGHSQGSLVDDLGPWHDRALVEEIERERARRAGKPATPLAPNLAEVGAAAGGAERQPTASTTGGEVTLLSSANGAVPSDFEAWTAASGGVEGGSVTETDREQDDEFQDAIARRMSSMTSAYMSAEESVGEQYYSDAGSVSRVSGPLPPQPHVAMSRLAVAGPAVAGPVGVSSDGESYPESPAVSKVGAAGAIPAAAAAQISILARVRALEDRLPQAERPLRQRFESPPSRGVGQGTLLTRVAALEKAMDTVLQAQQATLDERDSSLAPSEHQGGGGCCKCCAVM